MSALLREMLCVPAVVSVVLLAGCGGETPRSGGGSTPADTTPPAAAPVPTPAPADHAMKADTEVKSDSAGRPGTDAGQKAVASAPKPVVPKPSVPLEPAVDTASQPATADAPLRDAYHQPPHDTVTQEVYNGWKQYSLNCARCHGEDVAGTTIAPHLIVSLKPDGPINTKELFISTVCAGRPEKGMPAWCALGMEMNKIQDIFSYVKGRSDGKIAPGRPAVRRQG